MRVEAYGEGDCGTELTLGISSPFFLIYLLQELYPFQELLLGFDNEEWLNSPQSQTNLSRGRKAGLYLGGGFLVGPHQRPIVPVLRRRH